MKPLSYEARTIIPDSADVDRIVKSVMADAQFAQQKCRPGDALPQSMTAKLMAQAIKRRLHQLISVEVDLVISGSTDEDDTPAPVALPNGARIDFLSTARLAKERGAPSHIVFDEISDWDMDLEAFAAIREAMSTRKPTPVPLLFPWMPGTLIRPPVEVVRGSLPGLI
jgi:hypothetical protein